MIAQVKRQSSQLPLPQSSYNIHKVPKKENDDFVKKIEKDMPPEIEDVCGINKYKDTNWTTRFNMRQNDDVLTFDLNSLSGNNADGKIHINTKALKEYEKERKLSDSCSN